MDPEETMEEKAKKIFAAVVKNTAVSNMICMIYLINLPVTAILGMMFWNCELQMPETCSSFLSYIEWSAPPRIFGFLIMCFFILKKLYEKDQPN